MKRIVYLLVIISLIFSACSQKGELAAGGKRRHHHHREQRVPRRITYNYVLRSSDYNLKYQKAFEYYNKKKYYKALDLFSQLVPHYRGEMRGDEVLFYYALTNFKLKDYVTAGYYFKNFAYSYPNSEFAEEAMFMSAYCYYLMSPRWSLDQKMTNDAITQFELFLSKYPNSEKLDSVNHLIDKLRYKLQEKSYRNAKLYYDLGYYHAASISLGNSLKDYPDSPFKDDILYYTALSRYDYANKSIAQKQEQRYMDALDAILTYNDEMPNGKYLDKINALEKKINAKLDKIRGK